MTFSELLCILYYLRFNFCIWIVVRFQTKTINIEMFGKNPKLTIVICHHWINLPCPVFCLRGQSTWWFPWGLEGCGSSILGRISATASPHHRPFRSFLFPFVDCGFLWEWIGHLYLPNNQEPPNTGIVLLSDLGLKFVWNRIGIVF